MKVAFDITLDGLPPFGSEVNVDDLNDVRKLAAAIGKAATQIKSTWPKLAKAKVTHVRVKCEAKAPREEQSKEAAAA